MPVRAGSRQPSAPQPTPPRPTAPALHRRWTATRFLRPTKTGPPSRGRPARSRQSPRRPLPAPVPSGPRTPCCSSGRVGSRPRGRRPRSRSPDPRARRMDARTRKRSTSTPRGRTSRSNQLWTRRRCTDLYGTRWTNISDGKRRILLLLTLNQVNEYRNRQGGECDEEERGYKRHDFQTTNTQRRTLGYRCRLLFARPPRYL